MAKNLNPLSFTEIVTRADAATLRRALEARERIDVLLEEREQAYRRIYEVETQIEELVGEAGAFDFGEAPFPVAGAVSVKPSTKKKPAAATRRGTAAETDESEDADTQD